MGDPPTDGWRGLPAKVREGYHLGLLCVGLEVEEARAELGRGGSFAFLYINATLYTIVYSRSLNDSSNLQFSDSLAGGSLISANSR